MTGAAGLEKELQRDDDDEYPGEECYEEEDTLFESVERCLRKPSSGASFYDEEDTLVESPEPLSGKAPVAFDVASDLKNTYNEKYQREGEAMAEIALIQA